MVEATNRTPISRVDNDKLENENRNLKLRIVSLEGQINAINKLEKLRLECTKPITIDQSTQEPDPELNRKTDNVKLVEEDKLLEDLFFRF